MAVILSVGVFCGSTPGGERAYREAARSLGGALAEAGIRVVFGGGGTGLMGECASAALGAGGDVVGVTVQALLEAETPAVGLKRLVVADDVHDRKRIMIEESDCFVVLPGGAGTCDEFFEVWTQWILGVSGRRTVLVNVLGFFDPLVALLGHLDASGFLRDGLSGVEVVGGVEEAMSVVGEIGRTRKSPWSGK